MYLKQITIFSILIFTFSAYSMDEPESPIIDLRNELARRPNLDLTEEKLKAGLFDSFEFESEDNLSVKLKQSFFGSLPISSINVLKKTCHKFNKIFSFENPSSEFFSYQNLNIVRKDIKRKLIVALYDQNDELVESISHHPKISKTISYSFLIEDISLFPFKKKNHWRLGIAANIDSVHLKTVCNRPFPLLSAYISGNYDLEPYIKVMDLTKEKELDKLLLVLKLVMVDQSSNRFLKLKGCFSENFLRNIGKDLMAIALDIGYYSGRYFGFLTQMIENKCYKNINEIRTWSISGELMEGTLLDVFYLKYEESKRLKKKEDEYNEYEYIGRLIYSLRSKDALTQKEAMYKDKRDKEVMEITVESDSKDYCCCQ